MVRIYCDKCGKGISGKGRLDANICVGGGYTADLCEKCVELFDKMALTFINDHTEQDCTNCRFYHDSPFEEPCKSCGVAMNRTNWRPMIQNEKR